MEKLKSTDCLHKQWNFAQNGENFALLSPCHLPLLIDINLSPEAPISQINQLWLIKQWGLRFNKQVRPIGTKSAEELILEC